MQPNIYAPRIQCLAPSMIEWYFIAGVVHWARPSRIRTGGFSRAAAPSDLDDIILLLTGALPSELRN